jgi:hypothetical protein
MEHTFQRIINLIDRYDYNKYEKKYEKEIKGVDFYYNSPFIFDSNFNKLYVISKNDNEKYSNLLTYSYKPKKYELTHESTKKLEFELKFNSGVLVKNNIFTIKNNTFGKVNINTGKYKDLTRFKKEYDFHYMNLFENNVWVMGLEKSQDRYNHIMNVFSLNGTLIREFFLGTHTSDKENFGLSS